METRKIIIVDSSTQRKVVVDTNATTFGELKSAARAAGINYEGKDWLEGITKTTPMSDDSLLPTNVNYKGTVTNNLVYMLTNTNKRIKSGYDRPALYSEVRRLGLAGEIKRRFGRNYTQVSNEALAEIIAFENSRQPNSPADNDSNEVPSKDLYQAAVKAIANFLAAVPENVMQDVTKELNNINKSAIKEISFSDDDIDNLFD